MVLGAVSIYSLVAYEKHVLTQQADRTLSTH